MVTEAIGLPLLYIALHLGFAGMGLDSPDNLQLYNNSLGRLAFIAATLVFGLSILTMLRPEKKEEASDQEMWVPWPRRFSRSPVCWATLVTGLRSCWAISLSSCWRVPSLPSSVYGSSTMKVFPVSSTARDGRSSL